jgi:putative nucleotidyltransferase with HDIG domain
MISLATLAKEIDHLDPIPITLPRLAQLASDPNANLLDMVEVIEYDPALTANVLRLANSAYFSRGVPVYTIQVAVTQLGIGRILQHALGRSVKARMNQAFPAYDLEEHELWKHSIATALAADMLPRYSVAPIHPVAFTAALLHDIGKLVIARQMEEDQKHQILTRVHEDKMSYVDAERAVLGFDHAQVGGVVAERWGFPQVLVDCIKGHHDPRRHAFDSGAMDAAHIGNIVAKMIGVGMGSEEMNLTAYPESAKRLGLNPTSLESLCATTAQELPAVIELYEEDESGI